MRWRSLTTAAAALVVALGREARAQGAFAQGIVDVEGWKTSPNSFLLERNEGRAAALGRLTAWAGYEHRSGFTVYALGEVVGGNAVDETELELEQGGVRWSRDARMVVDVGRITSPMGGFAARRLSTRNPLIGEPDGYPVTYPLGAQLSGALGTLDWRAAVTSLPLTHENYSPDPSSRARPAVALGWTPATGIRVGGSYTAGAYLNCDLASTQLAGREWHDFRQRVAAAELSVSRGYFELWSEAGWTSYDVPGRASPLRGATGYVEARYTMTPRFYVATRLEENDYPFIRPISTTNWLAVRADARNGEIGAGFRATSSTLLKASVRRGWRRDSQHQMYVDGTAFAVQLSQAFDVLR